MQSMAFITSQTQPTDNVDFCRYQIDEVADVAALYSEMMELIMRFARHGLIHGDFNEFNLLIRTSDDSAVVIDFPQMTSLDHFNGPELFARDVACVRRFFRKRFAYESSRWPTWEKNIVPLIRSVALDQKVAASGFTRKDQKAMNDIQAKIEAENPPSCDESGESAEDTESDDDDDDDSTVTSQDGEDVGSESSSDPALAEEGPDEETELAHAFASKTVITPQVVV